jgi:basic membrane protein A
MIAQQGVDVLYAAAGASGLGVIAAARQARIKAIGVDSDQSHVARDVVITSMRKRLDRAVETAIADVRRESFTGGVTAMSLANGGVDLVLPGRLPPVTVKLVEKARAAVVAGWTSPCVKEEDRVPAWPFPPRPMG